MRRVAAGLVSGMFMLGAQASELPVWFDTFQVPQKSSRGWQSFQAAYKLGYEESEGFTAGHAMKAHVRFSEANRKAVLIWRFPDMQVEKFHMRVKLPSEAKGVYLQMVSNDTKGDAAFFKPWNNGKALFDLPIHTAEGVKVQPASPLPAGEWVVYEVAASNDVFYEQKKMKHKNADLDFSLMNTGRDGLKLSADSRPATEVFWISFIVPADSELFGKELEILVDLAEIY